ncbi:hypothetical protein OY671_013083, partial [Metschnikowia pulcherrima]
GARRRGHDDVRRGRAGGDGRCSPPPRRAVHRRRGDDRSGPHRHAAGSRTGGRGARHPVPRQGPDRRIDAAGCDAGARTDLPGASVHRPREDVLPFVELYRQPDRSRRRARQSGDSARGAGAGAHRHAGRSPAGGAGPAGRAAR